MMEQIKYLIPNRSITIPVFLQIKSEAYYQLSYLSYREYFTHEQVENYIYNAFYKKLSIGDRRFILVLMMLSIK